MRKRINWDKVLFWMVLLALVLSCMTNEDERIQNSEKIRILMREVEIVNYRIDERAGSFKDLKAQVNLLFSEVDHINYLIQNHTHYYNDKMKPLK